MIKYEDYITIDFTLNDGQSASNVIISSQGYSTRQRRAVRGYDIYSVRLCGTLLEITDFESFWALLNNGNDKFNTDQVINGDITLGKIVRFYGAYSISQLSDNLFEVTIPLELIQTGA